MKITNLRVERYRSLYDVSVDLDPLMLLVGANGSGKSNFVDVLSFLGITLSQSLGTAVNQKGGIDRLAFRWKGRATRPIRIQIIVRGPLEEFRSGPPDFTHYLGQQPTNGAVEQIELEVVYGFRIAAHGKVAFSDFGVIDESVQIGAVVHDKSIPFLTITREGPKVLSDPRPTEHLEDEVWREIVGLFAGENLQTLLSGMTRSDELLIATLAFNRAIEAVVRLLRTVQVYRISPEAGRFTGMSSPAAPLWSSGSNLPSAVKTLQDSYPAAWDRVLERMQELDPRVSDIGVILTPERTLALQVSELGAGRPWTAAQVSDGTIRMLALLTAVYDPRIPILAIEEPENSLHPWMARSFVEACRDVVGSGGKQIILTSHSPALMDFFSPDEILVAWRDSSGRSSIAPLVRLDPDIRSMWDRGVAQIFDMLDSGLVRQTIPGAF